MMKVDVNALSTVTACLIFADVSLTSLSLATSNWVETTGGGEGAGNQSSLGLWLICQNESCSSVDVGHFSFILTSRILCCGSLILSFSSMVLVLMMLNCTFKVYKHKKITELSMILTLLLCLVCQILSMAIFSGYLTEASRVEMALPEDDSSWQHGYSYFLLVAASFISLVAAILGICSTNDGRVGVQERRIQREKENQVENGRPKTAAPQPVEHHYSGDEDEDDDDDN